MITPEEPSWEERFTDWLNLRDKEIFDELTKPLNGVNHMARTYENEDERKIITHEILIARIQQFYDHLCQRHKEIQSEREQAEKEEGKELDWPTEMLSMEVVDQYYEQFEDVLSDKVL